MGKGPAAPERIMNFQGVSGAIRCQIGDAGRLDAFQIAAPRAGRGATGQQEQAGKHESNPDFHVVVYGTQDCADS